MTRGPLARVLAADPPPFALLYRPETTGPDVIEVLVGELSTPGTLRDLPAPTRDRPARDTRPRHDTLVLVPYRQISERGYDCPDDGAPLLAMTVTDQVALPMTQVLARLPEVPMRLAGAHFDIDDATYAATVSRIIEDEIGTGKGANFVIKRSFVADVVDHTLERLLAAFRRLIHSESGAYWTFLVHMGERTFLGATPERHVSLSRGTAVMNPISGTYRYPPSGPRLPELLEFLDNRKESDELYMVVDEELKMMARVCERGGRVVGPYLKEMARLAHTEYLIEGTSTRDVREILRETMFAPTVTGSPLESACRVIARYEPRGRGYYSGVIALVGRDERGGQSLDSSIVIRTAEFDARGGLRLSVGATLVRHSDPASEAAETRAKSAGLLAALESAEQARHQVAARPTARGGASPATLERSASLGRHPAVRASLARRNETIARFWLSPDDERVHPWPCFDGRRVLVVDAEDTFTAMIAHQLRSLGLAVTVRRFDEPYTFGSHDLVVMGPGPGDPRDADHPKIAHLRADIGRLLEARRPFLAVCLSHQVLSEGLGFELVRRPVPNQGVRREINLFGSREQVGFYNTFAARTDLDAVAHPDAGALAVSRDPASGEVHALRGTFFASTQFHAESVLTRDGPRILGTLLAGVLGLAPGGRDPRTATMTSG